MNTAMHHFWGKKELWMIGKAKNTYFGETFGIFPKIENLSEKFDFVSSWP